MVVAFALVALLVVVGMVVRANRATRRQTMERAHFRAHFDAVEVEHESYRELYGPRTGYVEKLATGRSRGHRRRGAAVAR